VNFLDLQDRAQLLASFEAYTDIDPPPDWPTLVNQAWREYSWDGEILVGTRTVTTLTGVSDYTLTGVKIIYDVTFGGVLVARSDENFERYAGSGWLTTADPPARWCATSVGSFALIPAPSTASAPVNCRCCVEGDDMVLDADEPGVVNGVGDPIPPSLHEAVAVKAATLLMRAFAADVGRERLSDYEARYQQYVVTALRAGPTLVSARVQATGANP